MSTDLLIRLVGAVARHSCQLEGKLCSCLNQPKGFLSVTVLLISAQEKFLTYFRTAEVCLCVCVCVCACMHVCVCFCKVC